MDLLLEQNEFAVPNAMVTEEATRMRDQMIERMQAQTGSDKAPELGIELFTDDATRRVKLGLLMAEIIKQNEIKPDPDRVRERIESMASSYENPQQVVDYYYSNQEYMQNVEGLVLEQLVADWVCDQATVETTELDFDAVMNPENNQPE